MLARRTTLALFGLLGLFSGPGLTAAAARPLIPQWSPGLPAKLVPANPQASESFGESIDISVDTAVVGSPFRDSSVGVNSGIAVIFERNPANPKAWSRVKELVPAGTMQSDQFGSLVAIEGDTALISTRFGSSGVYVFERDSGGPDNWGEVQKLSVGSGSVIRAMSTNGDTAVFGTFTAAHVFERSGGTGSTWSETALIQSTPGEDFAAAVAISGDCVAVGAPRADGAAPFEGGAIYVFERDLGGPGAWGQAAFLTQAPASSSQAFGESVAIHGTTLLGGAPGGSNSMPGVAFTFERTEGSWEQSANLAGNATPFGRFGSAVQLSESAAIVGADNDTTPGLGTTGKAFLFSRTNDEWVLSNELSSPYPLTMGEFGFAVALDGRSVAVSEPRGDAGVEAIAGLAYDPVSGKVFGSDPGLDQIVTVTNNGKANALGPSGFDRIEGLAFDPGADLLYGSETITDQLIHIDPTTGHGTAVGSLGFDRVRGLAYDTSAGTLYGSDTATDQLISIDVTTGAGTAVGPLGFADVRCLAFDSAVNQLYGVDKMSKQLIVIDRSSGSGSAIGTSSFSNIRGLSASSFGSLIGANDPAGSVPKDTLTIDPATGAASLFSTYNNLMGNPEGVGYVFEIQCPPINYCTAGTSSSGCQASISGVGTPSTTLASGFSLVASAVEGGNRGLFYYGTSGRQAVPWGNGTSYQCVVPPITRVRTPAPTGTSGMCDGTFSSDLNVYWTLEPQQNPGPGITVNAQLWYRDAGNTANVSTSLSDALEFAICP